MASLREKASLIEKEGERVIVIPIATVEEVLGELEQQRTQKLREHEELRNAVLGKQPSPEDWGRMEGELNEVIWLGAKIEVLKDLLPLNQEEG